MEEPILTRTAAVELLKGYHNTMFVIPLQTIKAERFLDSFIENLNNQNQIT